VAGQEWQHQGPVERPFTASVNIDRLDTSFNKHARQAKVYNSYKNTKLKLLKTNAALWFNKICKTKQLQPKYINIKVNNNDLRRKKKQNLRNQTSHQSGD
jgi:hypothetical protein